MNYHTPRGEAADPPSLQTMPASSPGSPKNGGDFLQGLKLFLFLFFSRHPTPRFYEHRVPMPRIGPASGFLARGKSPGTNRSFARSLVGMDFIWPGAVNRLTCCALVVRFGSWEALLFPLLLCWLRSSSHRAAKGSVKQRMLPVEDGSNGRNGWSVSVGEVHEAYRHDGVVHWFDFNLPSSFSRLDSP